MTHLRDIMLEELQRRNYSDSTSGTICGSSRSSHNTSASHPTSSAQIIFAATKLICSRIGGSAREQSSTISPHYGSSLFALCTGTSSASSFLSLGYGKSCPRSSAGKKSLA